jgi:hypothetical protein
MLYEIQGVPKKRAHDLKMLKESTIVPAESWWTFVGYCVTQLIAVCVLNTETKISALFEQMLRFITN